MYRGICVDKMWLCNLCTFATRPIKVLFSYFKNLAVVSVSERLARPCCFVMMKCKWGLMRVHSRWISCSLNTQAGLDRWQAAWHNICSDPPSKGRVEGMMEGCDGLVLSECLLLGEPDLHTALLLFPTVGRRTWKGLNNKNGGDFVATCLC